MPGQDRMIINPLPVQEKTTNKILSVNSGNKDRKDMVFYDVWPMIGEVIAVGPEAAEKGVGIGDIVYFEKNSIDPDRHHVILDKKDYLWLRYGWIIGLIKKADYVPQQKGIADVLQTK